MTGSEGVSWIPWFKVDDSFHASRRWLSIPKRHRLSAAGLWVVAGSWCADQLTDGRVPGYMVEQWGATDAVVSALVDAGLWSVESGGFVFAKWDEYQPNRADVEAERAASRERMRAIRARRKGTDPSNGGDVGGVFGRTVPNGSESVREPDPTRPDPTNKREAAKRGARLPESWNPNDKHRHLALELGVDLLTETAQFRDHALATGRVMKDWDAAFRTWLRKSRPMNVVARPVASSSPSTPSPGSAADQGYCRHWNELGDCGPCEKEE